MIAEWTAKVIWAWITVIVAVAFGMLLAPVIVVMGFAYIVDGIIGWMQGEFRGESDDEDT